MSRAGAKVKEAESSSENYWTGHDPNGASWHVYNGDSLAVLKTLPPEHFHCVVTSPPYFWLRDYNVEGQIGHEENVTAYVDALAAVMDGVYRVLRRDGLVFLNLGTLTIQEKENPTALILRAPNAVLGCAQWTRVAAWVSVFGQSRLLACPGGLPSRWRNANGY